MDRALKMGLSHKHFADLQVRRADLHLRVDLPKSLSSIPLDALWESLSELSPELCGLYHSIQILSARSNQQKFE